MQFERIHFAIWTNTFYNWTNNLNFAFFSEIINPPQILTNTSYNLDKHILQFDLNKYILRFEQIHFAIWTNTIYNWTNNLNIVFFSDNDQTTSNLNKYICNLNKYILRFEQINFAIWTNTFCDLNKFILQFEQIHFAIRTNTFCNLNKYILQLDK